jgi:hypothetical protein
MADADQASELRAVLAAYKLVKDASWPDLHPGMRRGEAGWAHATAADLKRELDGYVAETAAPGCNVRLFWKLGRSLTFGGCNAHFARDAGLGSPSELVGLDDFSDRLPWAAQAAKYRFDDKEIVDSGLPRLDILERQNSSTGVVWVLVGKAPVRSDGRSIGILGMYEQIDNERAKKLFAQRSRERA